MQQMNRKKNQNKTKIGCPKSQKTLKNLRKNNKKQQMNNMHFDAILASKTLQKGTQKRPNNKQQKRANKKREKSPTV